jgi:hypothetical protein
MLVKNRDALILAGLLLAGQVMLGPMQQKILQIQQEAVRELQKAPTG